VCAACGVGIWVWREVEILCVAPREIQGLGFLRTIKIGCSADVASWGSIDMAVEKVAQSRTQTVREVAAMVRQLGTGALVEERCWLESGMWEAGWT
jgi:hypothetical protein